MYRHVTLRFTDLPVPLVRDTKALPVRIIGHPLSRDRDAPFAKEYLLLVRGSSQAMDATQKILTRRGEAPPRLDCAEPGARIYQGSLELPSSGPVRGLLTVLAEALGTVLELEPFVIEQGVLEVRLVTVPQRDSALRLRAIEQHAKESGLGLEVPGRHALTAPPVVVPRGEVLDLMEWEAVQAVEAAGCYREDPSDREAVVEELAEALGMSREEARGIVARAERRLLREEVDAWRRNISLATPPAPEPHEPSNED